MSKIIPPFTGGSISSSKDSWLPSWPNPADFRFDYFKLLHDSPTGLAELTEKPKVGIIGAGIAGMTVARELHRCGFEVTIFEASDRIGGRLYTISNPSGPKKTGMEMGAMRMPFFEVDTPEGEKELNNSLLAYYLIYEAKKQGYLTQINDFPNPGQTEGGTGIYLNGGLGPKSEYKNPSLILWPKGKMPDDKDLENLSQKVEAFGKKMRKVTQTYYTSKGDDWNICWNKMVAYYDTMTFNDLIVQPAIAEKKIAAKIGDLEKFDGDIGGMGMSQEETDLLYTIGIGDGSWGAFYNISALWFMRCTYFGFTANLKTVEGLKPSALLPNFTKENPPKDAAHKTLPIPYFEGIQSLVEYLYYVSPPGVSKGKDDSLYKKAKLYISSPVSRIKKDDEQIVITANNENFSFDSVVVTTTQWASQMLIDFEGFDKNVLPPSKIIAEKTQHNISSCKVFFPLEKRYWEEKDDEQKQIPQVIITDTFIQDIYGLNWECKSDAGVILASYTWEDDSLKLLPYSDDELADLVWKKLVQIVRDTTQRDISQYLDTRKPVLIQWLKMPTYIGCSQLYRAYNQESNLLDLSYNQNYGGRSRLYFAGENYGVEGGWTEPALRSALDCVLQILSHHGAKFKCSSFNFEDDYPKW